MAVADDLKTALAKAAAPTPAARPAPPVRPSVAAPPRREQPAASSGEKLAGGERRILTVLAQYPQGRTKTQIALLTGYSHNGGGFNNYLSSLRGRSLIEGSGDCLRATAAGLTALGPYEPLPTGQTLREYWMREVGKAEREILQVLCDSYPRALTKEEVAARTPTGYEPTGGGFNNALSRLRTFELIEGRGELRASDTLFEE